MRQDNFTFMPQFKLMIDGNHKPRIQSVNAAIRRRMRLVPFNVKIPQAEQDKELPEKLIVEHPAILRWMINGCIEWQKAGRLQTPDVVKDATEEYLKSEDNLSMWLEECCACEKSEEGASTLSQDLYQSFKSWSERVGDRYPIGYIDFGRKLSAKLGRKSVTIGRTLKGFKGIRLLTNEECGYPEVGKER